MAKIIFPRAIPWLMLMLTACFQWIAGDFPIGWFRFPLNGMLLALWLVLVWKGHRHHPSHPLVRYFRSTQATTHSLCMMLLLITVMGLTTQETVPSDERSSLGIHHLPSTWMFAYACLHLLTALTSGFLQGWARRKTHRWRFALVHGGLCLTLYAMFWGSADNRTLMAIAHKDHPSHEAVTANGKVVHPDYDFQLNQMEITTYPNGMPQSIEASLTIDEKPAALRVGRPYPVRWDEDVYLHSYDKPRGSNSSYAVLQLVKQPWKHLMLLGMVAMMGGGLLLFVQGTERRRT